MVTNKLLGWMINEISFAMITMISDGLEDHPTDRIWDNPRPGDQDY